MRRIDIILVVFMNFRVVQIFNTWCFTYGSKFRPSWFLKINQAALTKQVCITKTVMFPHWNQRLSIPSLFITMIHVRATFRSNNSLKFPTLSIWTTQHLRLLSLCKDLLNLIPTSSWSSNVLDVVFTPPPPHLPPSPFLLGVWTFHQIFKRGSFT